MGYLQIIFEIMPLNFKCNIFSGVRSWFRNIGKAIRNFFRRGNRMTCDEQLENHNVKNQDEKPKYYVIFKVTTTEPAPVCDNIEETTQKEITVPKLKHLAEQKYQEFKESNQKINKTNETEPKLEQTLPEQHVNLRGNSDNGYQQFNITILRKNKSEFQKLSKTKAKLESNIVKFSDVCTQTETNIHSHNASGELNVQTKFEATEKLHEPDFTVLHEPDSTVLHEPDSTVLNMSLCMRKNCLLSYCLERFKSLTTIGDDGQKNLVVDDAVRLIKTQTLIELIYEHIDWKRSPYKERISVSTQTNEDQNIQQVSEKVNIGTTRILPDLLRCNVITSTKRPSDNFIVDSSEDVMSDGNEVGNNTEDNGANISSDAISEWTIHNQTKEEVFELPKEFENHMSYLRISLFKIYRDSGAIYSLMGDSREEFIKNKKSLRNFRAELRKRVHKLIRSSVIECAQGYNTECNQPTAVSDYIDQYLENFEKDHNEELDELWNTKTAPEFSESQKSESLPSSSDDDICQSDPGICKESETKNKVSEENQTRAFICDPINEETDSFGTGSSCGSVEDIENELEELEKEIRSEKFDSFNFFGHTDGIFDRGTEYWIDGKAAISKSRRGAKGDYDDRPKKRKTRGIPNKHLKKTCITITDENDNNENTVENEELFSCDDSHNKETCNAETVSVCEEEKSEDNRHLQTIPANIILGKKEEYENLECAYAPTERKANKPRSNKRKKQRSNRQNTILFGLNTNNCAIDDDSSDTDDSDSDETVNVSVIHVHCDPL